MDVLVSGTALLVGHLPYRDRWWTLLLLWIALCAVEASLWTHLVVVGGLVRHLLVGRRLSLLGTSVYGLACAIPVSSWIVACVSWWLPLGSAVLLGLLASLVALQLFLQQRRAIPYWRKKTAVASKQTWHQWTADECLDWMVQSLPQANLVGELLRPAQLRGAALEHLTVRDLQSLGLSLGCAYELMDSIRRLKEEYPKPTAPATHHGSWLERHDLEYGGGAPMPAAEMPLSPDGSQRAQEVMRDRFGLTLPDPAVDLTTTETPSVELAALPPEFLQNMPPNIAQIALRKPHLVQKILESRRKLAEQSDRPAEVEEPWDEDEADEDETTELLRQRRVPYKAI